MRARRWTRAARGLLGEAAMRKLHFIALAVASLALSACNSVRLADSVDLTFDWGPLQHHDELHMPYAAGTDFSLYTIGISSRHTVGWTLESGDDSVVRVDSTSDGSARVTAVSAGTVAMSIVDADGQPVHDVALDVRQPDRAELMAHGPLIIDRPALQEDWSEIHVLAGHEATFEVRWFEGDTRLYGNGTLTAVADGDIDVTPRQTFLFEDREWVTFAPHSEGTYEVQLLANGQPVRTVQVVAVTADALDSVALYGMDEAHAHEGDLLTVLAQAYDVEGRAVFGVEYQWDLDGATQDGFGDLYRYALAPHSPRQLTAHFSGMEANVMIHATEGVVDSTNRLGCSVGGVGMPGTPLGAVALGMLALSLFRRRR